MVCEIVSANEALLKEITDWLDEEESLYQSNTSDLIYYPVRGFRCNWDLCIRDWRNDKEKIYVLVFDGKPIGFLCDYDILEIHPSYRGRGRGRLLAEHMMTLASNEGRSVVRIEIAPKSALPFWQKMDFEIYKRNSEVDKIYAYKPVPRIFELGDGERVNYSISYYAERDYYNVENRVAFKIFEGFGERISNSIIKLPERAYCNNPDGYRGGDCFVIIKIDGKVIYSYYVSEAEELGVKRDVGCFYYIDYIYLPQQS